MQHPGRILLALMMFLQLTACAGNRAARPGSNPDIINRAEVLAGSYATAQDVVRALHPNWLVSRTSARRAAANPIWVYVDGNRYGDISWLRNVPASTIGSIHRIDDITATTRWGIGHSEGVLYIVSFVPSMESTEN